MGLRPPPQCGALGVAVVLLSATCAGEVAAQQPVRVVLSERSEGFGAGCVEKHSVLQRTEAAIGRDVFAPREEADVELVLRVRADKSATLQLLDPQGDPLGHRNLRAESCSELTQALTLTLSLMLDFSTADVENLRQREAAPSSGEETEPREREPEPTSPNDAPGSPTTPTTSKARKWGWEVGAEGRVALGVAPPALYGVGVEGAVVREGSWAAALDVGYWFPREVQRAEGSTEVQLLQAGVALCPVILDFQAWHLWGCAAGSTSRVLLEGSGFGSDLEGSGWMSQAGIEVRPRVPLGPLFVTARAGAWGTLLGYRAVANGPNGDVVLFEASPITGRFSIGVSVPFD